jgi:hypothetical protein
MEDESRHERIEQVDLTPLDPCADTARFERMVARVLHAAGPELSRRQTVLSIWDLLARWRRPVLATSGLLATAALVVLLGTRPATTSRTSLAEACGVPAEWVRWAQAARNPTPAELLVIGQVDR